MHFYNTADAFILACERVNDVVTLLQGARINARKSQGAETVVHDLESQRTQWLSRIDQSEATRLVPFEIDFWLWLHFCRVRQIVNNCIKNILYTFVFKGSSTVCREEIKGNSTLADASLEIVD